MCVDLSRTILKNTRLFRSAVSLTFVVCEGIPMIDRRKEMSCVQRKRKKNSEHSERHGSIGERIREFVGRGFDRGRKKKKKEKEGEKWTKSKVIPLINWSCRGVDENFFYRTFSRFLIWYFKNDFERKNESDGWKRTKDFSTREKENKKERDRAC